MLTGLAKIDEIVRGATLAAIGKEPKLPIRNSKFEASQPLKPKDTTLAQLWSIRGLRLNLILQLAGNSEVESAGFSESTKLHLNSELVPRPCVESIAT